MFPGGARVQMTFTKKLRISYFYISIPGTIFSGKMACYPLLVCKIDMTYLFRIFSAYSQI
jgi:hypothetical protein